MKLPQKVLLVFLVLLVSICYLWNEDRLQYIKSDRLVLHRIANQSELAPPMWWSKFLCKTKSRENDSNIVLPVLMRDVTPALNKNVFLIESACKSKPTYRAWCAVESFSRENPEADVWFVMTSPTVNDDEGLPSRLLQNYTNLHVVTTDLGTVFKDTLLEEFFMSGRWHRDTPWPMIQLSDILRVALLWRFGGFYTDIDTVCLKNISPLRNFVLAGRSARNQIANGAFHFEHHHEFLAFLMPQMIAEYKPKLWGSMGPITMTKCIKNLCKIPDMRQIFPSNSSEPVKCGNITIIPNEYLLPYPWWEYKKVYEPGKWQEFMAQFKNKSYSIHAYENKSKRLKIVQGSDSVYEGAARNFCPFTHPLLA
nr:lactosylceramide 4-alpha-galactosyltransferase-like [Penaeus vannamei]